MDADKYNDNKKMLSLLTKVKSIRAELINLSKTY